MKLYKVSLNTLQKQFINVFYVHYTIECLSSIDKYIVYKSIIIIVKNVAKVYCIYFIVYIRLNKRKNGNHKYFSVADFGIRYKIVCQFWYHVILLAKRCFYSIFFLIHKNCLFIEIRFLLPSTNLKNWLICCNKPRKLI